MINLRIIGVTAEILIGKFLDASPPEVTSSVSHSKYAHGTVVVQKCGMRFDYGDHTRKPFMRTKQRFV